MNRLLRRGADPFTLTMTPNRNQASSAFRGEFALIGLAALVAILHALRVFQAAISDDAFIAYRYAKHLATGHGLVWNIGEPPVEGFTSLLHVLVLAAGYLCGLDIVVWGQILGVGFAGIACIAAAYLGREVSGGDPRVSVMTATLMALAPPLAAWARGGLETTIFSTFVALALVAWMRDSRQGARRNAASLIFFVATLTRPEAFGLALITAAFDAFVWRGSNAPKAVGRRLSAWWLYGACILGLLAWKIIYFGSPLPNTYYAKTGGGIAALTVGAAYVLTFLRNYGVLNLLLATVPFVLLPVKHPRRVLCLGACVALYSMHVARVGGDYQYFWRYLVPLLPMMCCLTACGAASAWDATHRASRGRRVAAGALVTLLAVATLAFPSVREIRGRPWLLNRPFRLVNDTDPKLFRSEFEDMGRALRTIARPHEKIASVAVGAIGYYSERPVLDLMGLNDRSLARIPVKRGDRDWVPGHMKGDTQEILRRRPEFIVMPARPADRPDAMPTDQELHRYPFMAELLSSPVFVRSYEIESHRLPHDQWLILYRLRDSPDRESGPDRRQD